MLAPISQVGHQVDLLHAMDADTKPTRNRARAREQGRFLSRKRGFMKKAHELHSKCDAEVYVVIRHNLRFYTYKASPMTDWPPAQRSIVRNPIPINRAGYPLLEGSN